MDAPIDTRRVERRALRLESVADLRAELGRIESAHRAGTLRHTGNWTPAQIVQHLARALRPSYDGFTFTLPWIIRFFGRMMKGRFLSKGFTPGFRLRGKMLAFAPDDSPALDAALTELRGLLDRIDRGERMTHPSPGLGPMTHDEWVRLHLRHAELHLGFLRP